MGAVAKICGGEQRPLPVLKGCGSVGMLWMYTCIPGLMKGATGSPGPLYPERAVQLLKGPKLHDSGIPRLLNEAVPTKSLEFNPKTASI